MLQVHPRCDITLATTSSATASLEWTGVDRHQKTSAHSHSMASFLAETRRKKFLTFCDNYNSITEVSTGFIPRARRQLYFLPAL